MDPILSNYLSRIKVSIEGTKATRHLNGDYENKCGLVLATQENLDDLEQTARIQFEERSISTKYIWPQAPMYSDEEVLVLGHKQTRSE